MLLLRVLRKLCLRPERRSTSLASVLPFDFGVDTDMCREVRLAAEGSTTGLALIQIQIRSSPEYSRI